MFSVRSVETDCKNQLSHFKVRFVYEGANDGVIKNDYLADKMLSMLTRKM